MFLPRIRELGQEWWDGHEDGAQLAMLSHGVQSLLPRPSLRNTFAWNGWSNPGPGCALWLSPSELYNSHSMTVHPIQKQGKTKHFLAPLQHNLLAGRQNSILQTGTQQVLKPFQLPRTVSWGSAWCQHNSWQGFIGDNWELVPTETKPSSERRGALVRNTIPSTASNVFSVMRSSDCSKSGFC